jgi:hypothetical protein
MNLKTPFFERSLTMRRIHSLPFVLLILTILLLASCSSGDSSKTTPGEWKGAGDQGFEINFTVVPEGNAISIYSYSYPVSCSKDTGNELAVSEKNIPIVNGKITIQGNATVTINFTSADMADGTWSVKQHVNPSLGACPGMSGTFSAKPK